jgi:hypothetical protein
MADASTDDPVAPNAHTVLVLKGIGVPPYSARGVKQTLEVIDQATQLRRTVNGSLRDISFSGFRKYKSSITGSDQQPPNFNGRWPGLQVTVDCIAELAYAQDNGETPERPVVPGSEVTEGAHTSFRPRLVMRIVNLSINHDEYGRQIDWSLDLEEI